MRRRHLEPQNEDTIRRIRVPHWVRMSNIGASVETQSTSGPNQFRQVVNQSVALTRPILWIFGIFSERRMLAPHAGAGRFSRNPQQKVDHIDREIPSGAKKKMSI